MTYPLTLARVCFAAREEYRLLLASGQEIPAEPSGKLRSFDELPAVGDWVQTRLLDDFALIESVEPRRTAFLRKAAGKTQTAQCVAANIDAVFLVCGLDGDFNPRRLERYLLLAHESGARPVVVLNKSDLAGERLPQLQAEAAACAGAVPIIAISAATGQDAHRLQAFLNAGETAALLGSSGAGKSTIANALAGTALATQPVREHDSRGRHTTTGRMLIPISGDRWLLDTPGMRELGLWAAGSQSLEEVFPEVAVLAARCRYGDCQHRSEPHCAVQAALAEGSLSPERWVSFQKLAAEARHHAIQSDVQAAQAQKRKWRSIHKAHRQHYQSRDKH